MAERMKGCERAIRIGPKDIHNLNHLIVYIRFQKQNEPAFDIYHTAAESPPQSGARVWTLPSKVDCKNDTGHKQAAVV